MESKPDIKMNTYWYPTPAEWEIHRRMTVNGLAQMAIYANRMIMRMKCPYCNNAYKGFEDVALCDICGIVVCKACSRTDGKQIACRKCERCLEPKSEAAPIIGNDFMDHLRETTKMVEE